MTKVSPAPDGHAAQLPRRSRRTIWKRVTIIGGSLIVLWLVASIVALFYFGADRPEKYEGRVSQIIEEHQGTESQGAVLLTGSSFFENWETSAEDLAPLVSVNVGIGGTRIGDQIHYIDQLVTPFNPRAIVVYAGSNDLDGLGPFFAKSSDEVVPKIQEYVGLVHDRFPELPIYYVGIVESPSREGVREEMRETNRRLAEWAADTGEVTFIDTASAMLTEEGEIDGTLFGSDRLHLNEAGYTRFATAIREVLVPELSPRGE